MARIFSSGFELNSSAIGVEWGGFVNVTFSTTTVRTGTYALRTQPTATTQPRGRAQFATAADDGPWFFRAYIRFTTLPLSENRIIAVSNSTTVGTGVAAYITVDGSGVLRLYDEDGVIGSPSSALSTGTWYRVELQVDRTPAAGSEIVRARLDGTEFAGAASQSLSAGIHHFYIGANLAAEAAAVGDWFWDDIAINNSTGSFQTTYPGVGSIIHIYPDATGDNTGWTNTFAAVDEVTPDDATTLISSNTTDAISDFNLAASGLGSSHIINVVAANVRFNGAGASSNATFVVRCKDSSGNTVEESSSITPTSATWRTNDTTGGVLDPLLTMYDLPGSSTGPWTATYLDSAQIGVRLTASSTNAAQVSTLWLLVEYNDSGTTTSTSSSTSTSISTSSTSSSISTSTSISTSSTSASTSFSTSSTSSSTSRSTSTSFSTSSTSSSISTSSTSSSTSVSTSSTSSSISTSSTSRSTSTSSTSQSTSISTSSTSQSTSISTSISTSSTSQSTSLSTSSTSQSTSISTSSTSQSTSVSTSISTSSTSQSTSVSTSSTSASTSRSTSTSSTSQSTSQSTSISTSSTSSSISTSSTSQSTSISTSSTSVSVSTSVSTSSTSSSISASTSISTSSTSRSTSTSISTSSTSQSTSISTSISTSSTSSSISTSSTSSSISTSTTLIDINSFPRATIRPFPMRFQVQYQRRVFK